MPYHISWERIMQNIEFWRFVLVIHFSRHRINLQLTDSKPLSLNQILYTPPFVLFSEFVFVFASVLKFLLCVRQICFSNLKLSFLLVFLAFFFLIFAFLDKVLCQIRS